MKETWAEPTGAERRRHRRAPMRMEALLEGKTPDDLVRLNVVDFSAGGFLCAINRPLAVMTRLGIRFQFPAYAEQPARAIETTAVVVRCEKPAKLGEDCRLAACFLNLADSDREHIQAYVDWYETLHEVDEEGREAVS